MLVRYVRNFGLSSGLSLFAKVELMTKSVFQMSGYRGVICLRPGTSDIKVFREIFLFGVYSCKVNITPCVIVDAGANIGLSSIYFATRFESATIYAIEPEATNFIALRQNVDAYGNIKPLQTALWGHDGLLKITDLKENQWAFTVEECAEPTPDSFSSISITSFMQQHGIEKIDILKMDIEGAEREVFSGDCHYWLARVRVIIIELHDWLKPGCSSVFFNAICRYNIRTTLHEGMLVIEINA